MGACLCVIRFRRSSEASPSAKVISINGDLHEYCLPITVFQVLDIETFSSPASFLCNSDHLYYDDFIPVIDSDEELQANQIYFVLPTSKLEKRLTATYMATLAVMASKAINYKDGKKRKKARISPVLDHSDCESLIGCRQKKRFEQPSVRMLRSGSVKRLQRYTSKRAISAVRSFRIRLSTIYEGTAL